MLANKQQMQALQAQQQVAQLSTLSLPEQKAALAGMLSTAEQALGVVEAEAARRNAAQETLKEASAKMPDPTRDMKQPDIDELRRLKKQPNAGVEKVMCAACTVLHMAAGRVQGGGGKPLAFLPWSETQKILAAKDFWWTLKAFEQHRLL